MKRALVVPCGRVGHSSGTDTEGPPMQALVVPCDEWMQVGSWSDTARGSRGRMWRAPRNGH